MDFNIDVIPPNIYSLEPTLELVIEATHLASTVEEGVLRYTIENPSGITDEFVVPVIQIISKLRGSSLILQTDSDLLKNYPLDEYGDYDIALFGDFIIGNKSYHKGRDFLYQIVVAEPIHIMPTISYKTPFEANNTVAVGGHLIPQLPATIKFSRGFPRGFYDTESQMQANYYGYFSYQTLLPDELPFPFWMMARYTDELGRLWSSEPVLFSSSY